MSIVPKETVEVIAQSIGINNLSPDAALALVPDVEYRMREIMQVIVSFLDNNHWYVENKKFHFLFDKITGGDQMHASLQKNYVDYR